MDDAESRHTLVVTNPSQILGFLLRTVSQVILVWSMEPYRHAKVTHIGVGDSEYNRIEMGGGYGV